MILADTLQALQDFLTIEKEVSKQVTNYKEHADIYKYLASGAGAALVVFLTYTLTSWGNTTKALKAAIVTLTSTIGILSEELHVNRADEVAHRGLDELRHSEHDRSYTALGVQIDGIEEDVSNIKSDVKELKTEHDIFHKMNPKLV